MLATLLKIFSYAWTKRIRYNRLLIIVAIVTEILSKISGLSLPFLLKYTIDSLADPNRLYSNTTGLLVIGYGVLWMSNPFLKTIQVVCKNIVNEKSLNLLVYDIFEHVIHLPMRFHLDKKTGAIIGILTQLRFYFAIFWDGFVWLLTPLFLETIAAIGLVTYFYGLTYGAGLLLVLIIYAAVNFITAKYTMKSQVTLQEKIGRISSHFTDIFLNFEAVKTFSNENYELKRCINLLDEQRTSARKASRIMEILGLVQNGIIGVGLTSILFYAYTQIRGNTLIFSDFVLLNTYILQFSLPMSYMAYAFRDSRQAYTVIKEALKIFDEKNPIINHPNSINLAKVKPYDVKFENVTFGYNSGLNVLNDISFEVPAGQKLAIVGPTGSGKSTIGKLIFRFFDVNEGSIFIDGQDIRKYSVESLRNSIAIIPQDTILFNESLYANIQYGKPGASEKEIIAAIETARLSELIKSLPEGYNTLVGERGIKLSGGERQRIAIARAILKQPKIFIFDEATSSLDSKTEKEIQENLEQISTGVTTIIIAHRLSTVVNAQKILVLDNGRISEMGTHEHLLAKKASYYSFWQQQMMGTADQIFTPIEVN